MNLGKRIPYEIRITPTMNHGFVVQVGCGTFAFESYQSMLESLSSYLSDPEAAEKEYNKGNPQPPPMAPQQPPTLWQMYDGGRGERCACDNSPGN